MPNSRNRFPARRRFLKQSAALTATASLPAVVLAAVAAPADTDTAATAADATAATPTSAAPASTPQDARHDNGRRR